MEVCVSDVQHEPDTHSQHEKARDRLYLAVSGFLSVVNGRLVRTGGQKDRYCLPENEPSLGRGREIIKRLEESLNCSREN